MTLKNHLFSLCFTFSDPCDIPVSAEVIVLLTSFVGIDPHLLLAESASKRNMSVYFGLPSIGTAHGQIPRDALPAYYQLVYRIVHEHMARYSKLTTIWDEKSQLSKQAKLIDTIKGYYSTDEVLLASIPPPAKAHKLGSPSTINYVDLYTTLGHIVHTFRKKFVISPYIILNKSQGNFSVQDHVNGFETLAKTNSIDVIAVQEGRGCAKGAYYWPTEIHDTIKQVDPVLDQIIRYLDPTVAHNVTFSEQYTGSNNEVSPVLK